MTGPRIFTPEYYGRMAAHEAGSWWNAGMRDVAARLLAEASLPSRGLLLDVGCGSGQTMAWFTATRPGWRAVGVDIARDGLRAAQAAAPGAVAEASALALPVADGSADLVITLDVLQHLPLQGGDRVALAEMRRVLAPRGVLLVRTNAQSFPHVADDPRFEFRKYETRDLRAKLEEAGFRVRRIGRLNALLGLAEIPRELRAARADGGGGYHGLLAVPAARRGLGPALCRRWLGFEGRLMQAGLPLPLGRTLMALCEVA